jgi:hypothetical protein
MKPFVRLVRVPYEEPHHLNLIVSASNGRQRGEIEIYANAADLKVVAERLRRFPSQDAIQVLWELGSEEPEARFAFYFRIRVFQRSASGRCAIEFYFNNNHEPPEREVGQLAFEVLPADLDRLAAALESFGNLQDTICEWYPDPLELS